MLDELTKGLARHVNAAKQLVAGIGPSAHAASEHRHIAIAEVLKPRGSFLRQPVIAVAHDHAHRAPWQEIRYAQLQPTERYGAGIE